MTESKHNFDKLMKQHGHRVRAILNMLVETPYFYKDDHVDLFLFLNRHRNQFNNFFEYYYGWTFIMDSKCARVYKPKWYNDKITEANRNIFRFGGRDECIGFMLLLEFFESQMEQHALTTEDNENLRFRFGDLLLYTAQRFQALFPEKNDQYSEEQVRGNVLRKIMPTLEQYRFILKIKPPRDMQIKPEETIYEALPALYHYNANRLNQSVLAMQLPLPGITDESAPEQEDFDGQ